MIQYRKYGLAPHNIVVVHGGPGAPGGVGALAEGLSNQYGVLEPFQSEENIDDQVDELRRIIKDHCDSNVILVGHSWGAWLSYIYAAKYPKEVSKLILISCGPFDAKYVPKMNKARDLRMNNSQRIEIDTLAGQLYDPNCENPKVVFKKLGDIMTAVDSYDPVSDKSEVLDYQPNVFKKIMPQLSDMRSSGELISMAKNIKCSTVVIHGEDDSHPYEGVVEPLSEMMSSLKSYILSDCGHYPWNETDARVEFYEVMRSELDSE